MKTNKYNRIGTSASTDAGSNKAHPILIPAGKASKSWLAGNPLDPQPGDVSHFVNYYQVKNEKWCKVTIIKEYIDGPPF